MEHDMNMVRSHMIIEWAIYSIDNCTGKWPARRDKGSRRHRILPHDWHQSDLHQDRWL